MSTYTGPFMGDGPAREFTCVDVATASGAPESTMASYLTATLVGPATSRVTSGRAFRLRVGARVMLWFDELTTNGILLPFALSLSKGLAGERQRKGPVTFVSP